ncbi:unnamed protein product [Albugo candida]|uniref:Uncharacterized protein n=1 Tax=Albugo candida TaxID=65357 RepID=A0A024GDH0_9STRA|nr:unnamed protein product [Albugo candida]|eukprot:CCI44881.1 unnamed protein product [Albugo candida]
MIEASTAANGYNSVKRVPTTFPKGNRDVASSPSIPFPGGSNRRRACSQKTMGFHTPVVHSSPSPSRPVSVTSFRLNSPHIMSSSREQVVNLSLNLKF